MAEKNRIDITCPKCGAEVSAEFYSMINVTSDPELKREVLSGTANRFSCPECGYEANMDMPFLYHDAAKRFMVYYIPERDSKDLDRIKASEVLGADNYMLRLVKSYDELIEKINIFELDFDDRAIELCKLYLLNAVSKEQPDLEIIQILFDVKDEKPYIVFIDEDNDCFATPLTDDTYDEIYNSFYEEIENYTLDSFEYVDLKFAQDIINTLSEY